MIIFKTDIEYMQERLHGIIEGKFPRWCTRDLAIASRLLIIVNEHAKEQIISNEVTPRLKRMIKTAASRNED
jgi:intergrase/recombinase